MNVSGENSHKNDISLLTAMKMRQGKRNLDLYLKFLDKQQRKMVDMYEYKREQTQLDLLERVRLKSSYLSDIATRRGEKESIAISRRESLNVLRAHNGRTWNSSTGTYTVKAKRPEKSARVRQKSREKTVGYQLISLRNGIYLDRGTVLDITSGSRVFDRSLQGQGPLTSTPVSTSTPITKLPSIRRENTDFIVRKDVMPVKRTGTAVIMSLLT